MASTMYILVVLVFGQFVVTRTEVYTALTHMKGLIRLEEMLNEELEEYLYLHPKTPARFHRLVSEAKNHTADLTDGDLEEFLGHPVNTFLLARRFRADWNDLGDYLKKHDRESVLSELIKEHVNASISKEDIFGCVNAIVRIQEVYRIDAKQIADGHLSHKTLTPPLSADHCFEIGYAYYQWDNHVHAYHWLTESLRRLDEPYEYKGELTKVTILEFLSWSEYMTDRLIDALNHTIAILKIDQENDFGVRNIEFLSNEVQISIDKGGPFERQDPYFKKKPDKEKEQYMVIYERLCRGESRKSKAEIARLKCFYDRKRHPLLVIRPLKVEVINEDPYIEMLRDVLYHSEMEYIKTKSAPMLSRATVTSPTSGVLEYADYRVSKSGWLEEHLHDNDENILKRVNRRTSIITGLNTGRNSAEALQIVNYGTAGHYEPHFDHAVESYSAILRQGMGNRIATVLFYMTDVEIGGSTVFVDAEAIARPSKGDAAFWYNLMKSGEGDPLTRHAGCPVVVGTKWVCNKWIHEQGNEFRRPCSLSIDE